MDPVVPHAYMAVDLNYTFANSETKTLAGTHVGTLAAFVKDNLCMNLDF